ncbi:MAG: hypothetical protein IJ685_08225 [Selenomonadaceae bacterium]|nr:hypothetical protein [Selenomonadaceae bacterium]
MSMIVNNNPDAWISIGELNRNIKDTVREFTKIVTGQEISYAGDNPSKYSMSEKMRAKIRALEQNQQNAKNGMIMLTMAQEGIQEQLDILKTIKLRALQAADSSTSDDDRLWLQKDIEDGFQKINDIAYEIEHNGINLLTGNVPIRETTIGWKLLLTPQVLDDSDMHLVDDVYFQLDGLQGPFDAFCRYQSVATPSTLLNDNSSVNFSGGTDGTSAQFKMDFSNKSVSDLVGKAFQVKGVNARGLTGTSYYAIIDSSRTGTPYNTGSFNVIDIAGMNKSAALNAIASKVSSVQSNYISAQASGDSIIFTPVNTQTESNNATFLDASTNQTSTGGTAGHEGATATGLGNLKTSGGAAATYKTVHHDAYTDEKDRYHPAWDERVLDTPATRATLSFNASGAADGSGFYFNGTYIKFVSDPTDPNYSSKTAGTGVTKIGLGWSGSFSTSSFNIQVNNGQFNITAKGTGTSYNNYSIIDGYAKADAVPGTVTGLGLSGLNATTTQIVNGVDGQRATYDMDLTAYDTTDPNLLETFIDELLTGSLHLNYKQYAYSSQQSIAYEFIDTKILTALEAKQRLDGSKTVDLNNLRTAVQGGTTIADAFINLMTRQNSRFSDASNGGQKILRATATAKGVFGNEDSLNTTADQLSHYTLDFKKWVQENGTALKNLPRYLDGKGFRFYCATDTEHWFNFVFVSGEDDDRPEGISGAHLETIPIDVSGLADITPGTDFDEVVRRLVQTVYNQANPHLIADDHNLCLAVNPDEGTLTVYDERKEDVLLNPTAYPNVRQMGAKIGDGVLDDVQKTTVTVPANQRQLAIQHTDYSAQYIVLHIPQTTINHIFALDPDWPDYSRFNITTQTGRDYLLGKTNSGNSSSAALNKGLEYLFSALTTVSAQNSMLRTTAANLFTNYENETAAESKIRDTDIAKAYVNFTKSNMLAKASETMLAQANQNIAKIIELLDRSKPADDEKISDKKSSDKKSDDKKSAVTDKKSADKKSSSKKSSDKKSALLGQIGTFATQRDKTANKNSSAQKSSTDKKVDNTTKKTSGKK